MRPPEGPADGQGIRVEVKIVEREVFRGRLGISPPIAWLPATTASVIGRFVADDAVSEPNKGVEHRDHLLFEVRPPLSSSLSPIRV
jgi:hypothetical protein